jgi:hypothetical protein
VSPSGCGIRIADMKKVVDAHLGSCLINQADPDVSSYTYITIKYTFLVFRFE